MTEAQKFGMLVIEDEAGIRRSVTAYFEDSGFEVLEAESGKRGLELFRAKRPCIVLTDLAMPEMTGLEVIDVLRQEAPEIPVIVVSGTGVLRDAIEAVRHGAWDYVTKPIEDMEILEHAVNRSLERARLLQENLRYQGDLEELLEKRTAALRANESELSAIYDSAPLVMLLVDEALRVRKANRTAGEMSGPSRGSLVGLPVCEVLRCSHAKEMQRSDKTVAACDACAIRGVLADSLATNRTYHRVEVAIDREGGDENHGIHVLVSTVPLRIAEKRVALLCLEDVTEQKHLEEQLRHAQKMEAVGQLAGGVAHDFNNLLQAILGYGEMALEDTESATEVHAEMEEVVKAAREATTLVRQLLAFSRRQVLHFDPVNLNQVLADLSNMIRRVIGEHIEFNVRQDIELGPVYADRGQIQQVLMNLCVNARDAMPGGGTISVATRNAVLEDAFCQAHPWAKPGRYACLTVRDTGCGMNEETLEQIFDPFFTTKEGSTGTGLGLATVYGIVRQHNGIIHVRSSAGAGTTFEILIPLAEDATPEGPGAEEEAPPKGSETILLAEDDDAVCFVAKRILEGAGYRVLTAQDGEDALGVFAEHAGEIDMVLLDVLMPKGCGYVVFEAIRRKRPDMRVLFASGYSPEHKYTSSLVAENMQLIQKPYSRGALLRKVRDVLDTDPVANPGA